MPISATGCKPRSDLGFTSLRRSAEHGFTLVEMMVVLVIIGLASAVVLFALPDPRGTLRQEAERLAARGAAARDSAIVSSRAVRLRIDQAGYFFEQRRLDGWETLPDKPFSAQRWQQGVAISAPATIAFDPTGGASPATAITIVRDKTRLTVRFRADGAIDVTG